MDGKNEEHCEQQKVWQCIVKRSSDSSLSKNLCLRVFTMPRLSTMKPRAALSYILANKLKTASMPAMAVRDGLSKRLKKMTQSLMQPLVISARQLLETRAVEMYSMPLLYLKGYHALQGYRVANWLWKQGRIALATYLQNQISVACQVDIHPAARINLKAIMLDHATGIVIGETAVVENDVSILQDVTLGGTAPVKKAVINHLKSVKAWWLVLVRKYSAILK